THYPDTLSLTPCRLTRLANVCILAWKILQVSLCPCASYFRCFPPGSKPTASIENRQSRIDNPKSNIENRQSATPLFLLAGPSKQKNSFFDVRSRNVYENKQNA